MFDHEVGKRDVWLAAREELLKREKEHTRLGDEITKWRRDMALGAGGEGLPI